ncbi:MAG TPA: ornithine carbamoyltransferase [Acidimicrobiales bacterium]|nr:ornithine carbamoyltransferase [Acidimicrobiales bacterium]
MTHFLEIDDLSDAELTHVLDMAQLTPAPAVLSGRGVALIFEKPSARTRNSSEVAVFQLGGHPVTIRGEEVGFDHRESVEDITRALAQYHAVLGARVFDHHVLTRMAAVSPVPVINLLSDRAHPCQVLADLLTLHQHYGYLKGLKVAWIGDGNNVCRSLVLGASRAGINVAVACPPGYEPDAAAVEAARGRGVDIEVGHDPRAAATGADAVFTDTWISMGDETAANERRSAFGGFTVDADIMGRAAPSAPFLHCLPAHRGEEVTDEVIDGPQSLVWQEAANRLHAFRGLLLWQFGHQL